MQHHSSLWGVGLACLCAAGTATAQSTVQIADGHASEIAPGAYLQYPVQLPGPNCTVTGRIEGVSGGSKDFEALLLGDDDFRNWSARLQARSYWQSGRVTVTTISAQVMGPATYHLVISNAFSVATAKTVQVWAQASCSISGALATQGAPPLVVSPGLVGQAAALQMADGHASEIAPGAYIQYAVQLPGPNCTVTGRIEGVSGGNKDFEALLLGDDDFRNWSARLQARAYWQSGRVTVTSISAQVMGPALYHLVVSNAFSLGTAKTVQVWAQAACQ